MRVADRLDCFRMCAYIVELQGDGGKLVHRPECKDFDLIAVGRALPDAPRRVTKVRTGYGRALKVLSITGLGKRI